eukprot:GHVN01048133.1.p1 GENE.GHVN01048133.1~~GHVN01048133.1.p1  ORF type:complete len:185 (-),score=20.92 GHVN01048133.1:265-819(-)
MVKGRETLQMNIRQYHLIGRAAPTAKVPAPKTYRMKLFAKNHVLATSKFWYFMQRLKKAKRSGGEILKITEIRARKPAKVKNFAIWLRYDSRTGTHNMYKEYRALNENSAVSQMYNEMAGRHRALSMSIQIMKISAIKDDQCRRPHITQLHPADLKFPTPEAIPMLPCHKRRVIAPNRPCAFSG